VSNDNGLGVVTFFAADSFSPSGTTIQTTPVTNVPMYKAFFFTTRSQFDYSCSITLVYVGMELINQHSSELKPNGLSTNSLCMKTIWNFEAESATTTVTGYFQSAACGLDAEHVPVNCGP
jgi:hypothetical protein